MNVGVGVPWGGRAADTSAMKAMVAQRMRVLSCMAAVARLEELVRGLRRWIGNGIECLSSLAALAEPEDSKKHSIYPSSFCSHPIFGFGDQHEKNGTSH